MANFILEALEKPFLTRKEDSQNLSSEPPTEYIDQSLEDTIPTGFFDNGDYNIYSGNGSKKQQKTKEQNELIKTYRRIASTAEVSAAVDEIVDEAVFSPGNSDVINMDFNKDVPLEVKDKFSEELKHITNKINFDKNAYSMFLQYYIDGQLNVHCSYDEENLSDGIKKISILSPLGLNFNYTTDKWEYVEIGTLDNLNIKNKSKIFDREEIIRIDSGIYSDNIILSNLHSAIKPANMLQTLEDMLIPMRFTRSVSRRVFNVDVSKLNNKKAEEVMKKNQAKFKYKKFYDLNTGTISNQQHISSLTEDYWFPNRGGEKGTTVDTIDETGNLGELSDVLYFKRKLYTTLKLPSNRINDEGSGDGEFDFDTTSINREEIKFFNFISRLRTQFLDLFYELLRRNVIAKGLASDEEWKELLPNMAIKFVSENKFFEKMERDNMSESLNLYTDIEDLIGKYFSYTYVFKKVLKMSDEDIQDMAEELESEKNDPLYKRFYDSDNEDDKSW